MKGEKKKSSLHLSSCAFWFLWALVPSPVKADAGPQRVRTLREALDFARTNHPLLRQARYNTKAASARADQARAPLLPQVTATGTYTRTTANFVARPGSVPPAFSGSRPNPNFDTFNFFNFGASATQLVYDFGQTSQTLDAAKSTVRQQESSEKTTGLDVLFNVRNAFFQARAAKAMLGVAEETLTNQEKHLAEIEGFVEVGARPEIDVAQSRSNVANARVQRIQAENSYALTKAQLNQAMGQDGSIDYDVSDDALPPLEHEDETTEALMTEAWRARPEVVGLLYQIRGQQQTLRATQGGYWPSLNVSTGVTEAGVSLSDMSWNWNAGVNVAWPLFQGGITRGRVREAAAVLGGLRAQLDSLRQQVRLEVEQSRLAVHATKAAIDAAEKALVFARARLALAEGRYRAGVGSIIELSDAQLGVTSAAAQKIQADYQLAIARAQLMRSLSHE